MTPADGWTRNNAPIVELPGVQLRFAKANQAQLPRFDHIGFDVKNLDAFLKKLQADGAKIERPINRDSTTGAALAFISDPCTIIESNDRPQPMQKLGSNRIRLRFYCHHTQDACEAQA